MNCAEKLNLADTQRWKMLNQRWVGAVVMFWTNREVLIIWIRQRTDKIIWCTSERNYV